MIGNSICDIPYATVYWVCYSISMWPHHTKPHIFNVDEVDKLFGISLFRIKSIVEIKLGVKKKRLGLTRTSRVYGAIVVKQGKCQYHQRL